MTGLTEGKRKTGRGTGCGSGFLPGATARALRQGSGIMLMGVFFMLGFFAFIMMFAEAYQMRAYSMDAQAAIDTVADSTAVFAMKDYSMTYEEALAKANETAGMLSEETGVDLGEIELDQAAFDTEGTVSVSASVPRMTLTNMFSASIGSTYTLEVAAATSFTRYMYDAEAGVAVGPSGTTDGTERLLWLFDGQVPTSEAEMLEWIVDIYVPALDTSGNEYTLCLQVHRKLADEITAIFEEMAAIGFPVAENTYSYKWRDARNGKAERSQSHHSYGCAVDLNPSSNPQLYSDFKEDEYGNYQPGDDPYSVTMQVVNIWKSHGFYWGGDWSSQKDYMHFSYTGH